jgi:peroxiredoxin
VQLVQLQNIEPQLAQLGYQIIAISPDRPAKLSETIKKHRLDYLLLSDSKMIGARALGLAFKVDEKTLERYINKFDIDLEEASGEKHHWLPVPAAFVLGTDGIIKFEYINPDHHVRINPDLLLAAAKTALQD